MRWMLSITLLLLCGCLKPSDTPPPETQASPQFAQTPATEMEAVQTTLKPVTDLEPAESAEPPVASAVPAGYTGAIVYGDPATCDACLVLGSDLWALRKHGWSVGARGSPVYTGTEDWILALPLPRHDAVPCVEFLVDGQVVDSITGYSIAPEFTDRRDALLAIVRKHPAAR